MTLADRFLDLEARIAARFGTVATLVLPAQDYQIGGTVTGSSTSFAVTVDGPVDETRRYAASGYDTRVSATFYVPAKGLSVAPTTGWEVHIGDSVWSVVEAQKYWVQGNVTGYRLDCAEVAADG